MSHNRSVRGLAQNALLLFVSFAFVLGLSEVVARVLVHFRTPRARCLLWSQPNFELDDAGAVRFARSSRVREVAVYGGRIEYDMVYPTNNMGYVDTEDYAADATPGVSRFAFVGDSFTAGSGGYPWPAALRAKRRALDPRIAVYNLGLPAAGPRQFLASLKSASRQLTFTHIVLLSISHDLKRSIWTPRQRNGRVYFRFEVGGKTIRHLAGLETPFEASTAEILARAEAAETQRSAGETAEAPELPRGSRLLWLYHDRWAAPFRQNPPDTFDPSALVAIRETFPSIPITFIHLPEKQEVEAGHYTREVRAVIESCGMRYVSALDRCRWTTDMYYPHDMHPNPKGYASIQGCVESCLFPPAPQASDGERRPDSSG